MVEEFDWENKEKVIDDEIIAKGIVKEKDPKYLYFLDANGDLRKRRKGNYKRNANKKKNKRTRIFNELNLTVPKVRVKGYMSNRVKKVIRYGKSGAMISMPNWTIGMEGRIIILPNEALKDIEDNTVNLF